MKRTITIMLMSIFGLSLVFSQKGRGRDFDPSMMPKIGVIQGTVLDSMSGEPIEYASVSVISAMDQSIVSGGLTKADGSFKIEELRLGRYSVAIQFIGYEKKEIGPLNVFPGERGGIEQKLGNIGLRISAIQMETVDVIEDAPAYIQTIDKQIFNVDKSLTAAGGTAEDALKKIPNVDVDIDGNISLRGDQNVTVLIDGKPSGMTHGDRRAMVDNIPAAMIERVEVISNPSAKYDPDGMGGIINIILKRGMFEGFNGSTTASAGEYGKLNGSGMLNYRVGNWNLTGNGSYRLGNRFGDGARLFNYVYTDSTRTLNQNTLTIHEPESISFRLGADYYLGSKNTFSLTSTFESHDKRDRTVIDYIQPAYGERNSVEWDKGSTMDLSFRYDRDFDEQERDFVFDITYNASVDEEIEEEVEEEDEIGEEHHHVEDGAHSHSDEKNSNIVILSDYTHPFGAKTILETGFKSTIKKFNTDLDYLYLPFAYNYQEDVHAAYATLSHKLTDKFGLKIGARAEQVNTDASVKRNSPTSPDSVNVFTAIIDTAIAASPFSNPYFQIYPSAFLLYDISKNTKIQFGYSKRVNRPRRRALNPFPRSITDDSRIRNGNPFLRPEYSDVLEFNFFTNTKMMTFNTGLSYKRATDMIQWWDRDMVVIGNEEYEILTADNAGSAEQFVGHAMINFRMMPFIMLTLNAYGWNSRTFGSGEPDLNGESRGIGGFGNMSLTVPGIAKLELTSRFRGKMKITYGHIPANATFDIAIQKSFFDRRLNVTLKINDLTNSGKFSIYTEQEIESIIGENYTQTMDAWRKRDRRTLSLVLNYNFGKLEQKRRWNREGMGGRGGGGGMMEMDY